jgi:hypothetical protein
MLQVIGDSPPVGAGAVLFAVFVEAKQQCKKLLKGLNT